MKRLLLLIALIAACGNIFPQTWQSFGVPEGGGVTDMVYWEGAGPNYLDKLWVTTSSENWPTGQWGGVRWSATTPPGQASWINIASCYIARSIAVGQDGKLYASTGTIRLFRQRMVYTGLIPRMVYLEYCTRHLPEIIYFQLQ